MSIFKRKPKLPKRRWHIGDNLERGKGQFQRVVYVYGPGWDPQYPYTTGHCREIIGHCDIADHNRLSELMVQAAARAEQIEDADRYADAARVVASA